MGLDCGIVVNIPDKNGVINYRLELCYMRKCYRLSRNMFDCINKHFKDFEISDNPNPYEITYPYTTRRFIATELFEVMLEEVDKEIERIDSEIRHSGMTEWLDTDSIWEAGVYIRIIHKVRLELQALIYWLEDKISLEILMDIAGQDFIDDIDNFDLEKIVITFYYSY